MNRSLFVSVWAVAAFVSACGGGGGGAGSPAPVPAPPPAPVPGPPPPAGEFNVNAAWRNLLSSTTPTWDTAGVDSSGKSHTISLSFAAAAPSVFPINGLTYGAADGTAVSGIQGLGLNQSVSRSYYDPATFKVAGTRTQMNADPAVCSVVTATDIPPTAAHVNDSGPLTTFDDRNGCSSTSPSVGTSVTTWSVETDASATPALNFFCLNTISRNTSNVVTGTESECLEIAGNGTLGARARITVTEGSLSLVSKNY
jgi:hypothetical protein